MCVAMRGFFTQGDKEAASDNRYLIVQKLLEAGAEPNYCVPVTNMTAMHWLAYQNDHLSL